MKDFEELNRERALYKERMVDLEQVICNNNQKKVFAREFEMYGCDEIKIDIVGEGQSRS